MSLFALYRVLECPGKVKLSTITDPGVSLPDEYLLQWKQSFIETIRLLDQKYGLPNDIRPESLSVDLSRDLDLVTGKIPRLVIEVFPIFKSGPSGFTRGIKAMTNHDWDVLVTSAKAIKFSPLSMEFIRWCMLTGNKLFLQIIEMFSQYQYPDYSPSFNEEGEPKNNILGRLAALNEPAGKVRVIAMLDPFTQWLMYPLHSALFKLFKKIPMDGTMDQIAPLNRLMSMLQKSDQKNVYSFDLSAATDRLPVKIQALILDYMLGSELGQTWKRIMTDRYFSFPLKKEEIIRGVDRDTEIKYSVGQPMGAYSSWAMLNLTHHLIVQWAYQRSLDYKLGTLFDGYAVLGDDIVIASDSVASHYLDIMKELGVEINLSKSLLSRNGSCEFAKRYYVNYQDASPLSFKELNAASVCNNIAVELCRKLMNRRSVGPKTLYDIFKRSFRAKSHLTSRISSQGTFNAGLLLSWEFGINGMSYAGMLKEALGRDSQIPFDHKAFKNAFVGVCFDAVKAFKSRANIFSFERNAINQLKRRIDLPSPYTKVGRFTWRFAWAQMLFFNYYVLVNEVGHGVDQITKLLHEYVRKTTYSYKGLGHKLPMTTAEMIRSQIMAAKEKNFFTEADFLYLLQLLEKIEEGRDGLPSDLRVRAKVRPPLRVGKWVKLILHLRRLKAPKDPGYKSN